MLYKHDIRDRFVYEGPSLRVHDILADTHKIVQYSSSILDGSANIPIFIGRRDI